MSYILDALKKSDQERKRGDVPGLQTVHIPLTVEQQSPRALYGFIVLLLIALAFVIGLLFREQSPRGITEQPLSISEQYEESAQPWATPAAVPAPARVEPEKTLVKAVVTEQSLPKKQPVKDGVVAVVADISVLSDIPFLHELPDFKQQSVPELEFAGHVYSSSPYNRSVIINGVAMSEGDTIVEGIRLEQITSSGVVFSLHGEKFRIDILEDWSFE